MSKNITFTANSLNKLISFKQFKLTTQLIHSKDFDQNHVLHSAVVGSDGKVTFTGPSATVGQILAFDMVPNEKKPGEMRRNFKFLPNLNVADASALLDFLVNAPIKGSGNGTVQPGVAAPVNPTGFGGAAS